MSVTAKQCLPRAEKLAQRLINDLDRAASQLPPVERYATFQMALAICARKALERAMKHDPDFGRLMADAFKKNIDLAVTTNVSEIVSEISEDVSNGGNQPTTTTNEPSAVTA